MFAVVYVIGRVRLRRRGDAWPVGRTVAWLLGCLVLLFATSSGVGRYMPAMFSMHMAAHMLLSMLAPILLVLGAPVTLACGHCPPPVATTPPARGSGYWQPCTRGCRGCSPTRSWRPSCSSPGSTAVLLRVFDAAVDSHCAHLAMNLTSC